MKWMAVTVDVMIENMEMTMIIKKCRLTTILVADIRLKDPTAIFFKSREFKDVKHQIHM